VAFEAFKGGYPSPVHPSSVVDHAVRYYRDKISICEKDIAKLEATLSVEGQNRRVAAADGWVRGREIDDDEASSFGKRHALHRRLLMLPGVESLGNFSKTGRIFAKIPLVREPHFT
jgi:hypothetical protein